MQEQVTNMMKLKFIRNGATLKVTNNTHETMTFDWTEMISILDLRSLGYYKIKQGVLLQNLSKYHKDAFHSLRLTENSKRYSGILLYFGSASYLYQRMPMGLNISPAIWQSYINAILDCLQSRKYGEVIMDDLLLFTSTKTFHFAKVEDLLKALCKNGLKISPKKCQLFKTELQYMGNTIFIKDKSVCKTFEK